MLHLHSKKKCFSIDTFVQCCHKVFNFIVITVPVHQREALIKLRDHQFVCTTRLLKFSFRLLRSRKRIDNSRKILGLDGNMLMWVLRELL